MPISSNFMICGALLIVAFSTACTNKSDSASIQIRMPKSVASSPDNTKSSSAAIAAVTKVSALDNGNNFNTALNPAVGSDLNCYAIFIGGDGLSGSTCDFVNSGVTTTVPFGPFKGLLAAGDETSIDVTAGSNRTIYVVGFKTASAASCRGNALPDNVTDSTLSEPFVIAAQNASIPAGTSTVNIQPVLNLNKKVSDCRFAGSTHHDGGGNNQGPTLSFGDKRDGSITLGSPASFSVNAAFYSGITGATYTPSAAALPGTKVISATRQVVSVDTATGKNLTLGSAFTANDFQAGDEVLWYISAGHSNTAPPDDPVSGACGSDLYIGRYGTATVASTTGTTVTLNSSIAANPAYVRAANLAATTGAANDFCRMALYRVPNFDQVTVTSGATITMNPSPYNPSTGVGGVLVLRAKKIANDGTLALDGSGSGYTGAAPTSISGSSQSGLGSANSTFANMSGGGSLTGYGGAGGAGSGGEGGSVAAGALGGQAQNYCENPNYIQVSSGTNYSCAVTDDGETRCWGDGSAAPVLGDGGLYQRLTPSMPTGALKFASISASASHTCAIQKLTNKLFCWGLNNSGELGTGDTVYRTTPTLIDSATDYASVSAGGTSTCAITTAGILSCWGNGTSGQLGTGATPASIPTPTPIDTSFRYQSVAVGNNSACAITTIATGNVLKCWGNNASGQLGDSTTTTRLLPITVDSGLPYQAVGVGTSHACGVTTGTTVKCWGLGTQGQLGGGSFSTSLSPILVGGSSIAKIWLGANHSCSLDMFGTVRCWGLNNNGQVGDGTPVNRNVPTLVNFGVSYSSLAAGLSHTCATTTTGFIHCWGAANAGQMGNGAVQAQVLAPTLSRTQRSCLPLTNQKAYFGGGGASGSGAGGHGGGIVLIYAREIAGAGSLTIAASGSTGTYITRAGGSGGGGTVALATKIFNLNGTILVAANGGSAINGSGLDGGAGGGGMVEAKSCTALSGGALPAASFTAGGGGTAYTDVGSGALGGVSIADETSTCSVD